VKTPEDLKISEVLQVRTQLLESPVPQIKQAKWILQTIPEKYCQHQEEGRLKLEEAMNALELGRKME
ncbi:hypothetical protein U0070_007678, partial [Myodes glareolus]